MECTVLCEVLATDFANEAHMISMKSKGRIPVGVIQMAECSKWIFECGMCVLFTTGIAAM